VPRARDPNRDKAYELYRDSNGKQKLKEIAEQLEVAEGTVRGWKNKDKWDDKFNGTFQTKIRNVPNKKTPNKTNPKDKRNEEEPTVESDELTDKQRLFCMFYLKYFNTTKAYQKAYECGYNSARANGARLIANDSIISEINRMKEEQAKGLMLDASFVLQKYIDIAFADITDFVEFGREEVTDDLGNPYEINRVKFRESNEVDGTLITEVKQGKDGVSVKLADKMKALEMLSKYFDLFPDKFKREIEQEKLKIAHHKAFGSDNDEEYEDDGFLEALDGKTTEVWSDFDE
jgi:phage terminase small subunit